jgi:hypothetical protein
MFNDRKQLHESRKYKIVTINEESSPTEVMEDHNVCRVRFSPWIKEYEPEINNSPLEDMSILKGGDCLTKKYSLVNGMLKRDEFLTKTLDTKPSQETYEDEENE